MERDNYNLTAKPDCVFTLKYGPVFRKDAVEVLGDVIYNRNYDSTTKPKVPICTTDETYIDCTGKPKFTLPLHKYKELSQFK